MKTNSTTKTITVEASSNNLSSPFYIGFRMVYKKKKGGKGISYLIWKDGDIIIFFCLFLTSGTLEYTGQKHINIIKLYLKTILSNLRKFQVMSLAYWS